MLFFALTDAVCLHLGLLNGEASVFTLEVMDSRERTGYHLHGVKVTGTKSIVGERQVAKLGIASHTDLTGSTLALHIDFPHSVNIHQQTGCALLHTDGVQHISIQEVHHFLCQSLRLAAGNSDQAQGLGGIIPQDLGVVLGILVAKYQTGLAIGLRNEVILCSKYLLGCGIAQQVLPCCLHALCATDLEIRTLRHRHIGIGRAVGHHNAAVGHQLIHHVSTLRTGSSDQIMIRSIPGIQIRADYIGAVTQTTEIIRAGSQNDNVIGGHNELTGRICAQLIGIAYTVAVADNGVARIGQIQHIATAEHTRAFCPAVQRTCQAGFDTGKHGFRIHRCDLHHIVIRIQEIQLAVITDPECTVDLTTEIVGDSLKRTGGTLTLENVVALAVLGFTHIEPAIVVNHFGCIGIVCIRTFHGKSLIGPVYQILRGEHLHTGHTIFRLTGRGIHIIFTVIAHNEGVTDTVLTAAGVYACAPLAFNILTVMVGLAFRKGVLLFAFVLCLAKIRCGITARKRQYHGYRQHKCQGTQ